MGIYNSRKSLWERRRGGLVPDNIGPGTPEDKKEEIITPSNFEGSINPEPEDKKEEISKPVKKNKNTPQNLPEDDK